MIFYNDRLIKIILGYLRDLAGDDIGTAADETCPKCGGEMYQRDDDNEATVRNRLDVYEKSTAPLIDYYRGCDLLVSIDGDRDPNVVYADVKKALAL